MATETNKKTKPYANRQSNKNTHNSKGNHNTKKKTVASKKTSNSKFIEDKDKALFQDEIILITTLVISLLLILSNFNLSGNFGDAINNFTFGMFGFIAYLLPFCLFFGVAFFIANRNNKIAERKVASGIALVLVLTALIELISTDFSAIDKISDYYMISAETKNGGGIIGGIICRLFHPLFGIVGTYIILIAAIIVFLMLITGKALFAYLGTKSGASIQEMRQRKARRNEELLLQQQEMGEDKPERRPARTVVLKKKQEELTKDFTETSNNQASLNIEEVHNLKKKKKNKNSASDNIPLVNFDNAFDMEEIKGMDANSIPIQRGGTYQNPLDKTLTYEEQLKMKFGKNQEMLNNTEYVNKERPGLDDDIKELLHAANQDATIELADNTNTEQHLDTDQYLNVAQDLNTDHLSKETPSIDDKIYESIDAAEQPFEVVSSVITMPNKEIPNTSTNKNAEASIPATRTTKTDTDQLAIVQNIEEKKEYKFPPIDLLTKPKNDVKGMSDKELKETAIKLQKTLESFGVRVTITNVSCGPAVTRYELQPEQGVKVSRITGLADDIKLNLAAADVRIEAPIPGKAAVGIEVPNKDNTMVMFRELIESSDFKKHPSDIAFAVGKDIGGQTVVTDIAKMPHLLIAGATGSGKSVCINTLIMSILYKAKPSDVRMIMVDPKVVELSVYNGIPHLLIPVVTDPKKASAALNWAVMEMTERYNKFAEIGVRDIKGYNEKIATVAEYKDEKYQKLPQIVIIVDELADLMMVAPGEVEDAICRLAQMARAAGLHLIIATQRPSVNVITGLIKANVPSRIAFSVSSSIDSRTIIDGSGAEKLLGKGDMLFFPSGYPKPVRVQGAFVSDKEVGAVVEFLTSQNSTAEYSEDIANKITNAQSADSSGTSSGNDKDDYFIEAGKFIIDKDKASIGMLQRVYKIGFNRAARIMDQLSDAGVVGPEEGTKPRKVLMSIEEFEQYVDEYV
jgi:S-DNA-T family DNA segregation ATPase FtsK/SpoIIIE